MRKWFSAAAIVAALVCVEPVLADSPASVYSDFAEDGVLSCGHSRSALKGVLNDASLNQYGDPQTFLQLKLAVRKQLAGGCRRAIKRGPADSAGAVLGGSRKSAPAKPKKRPGGSEQSTRETEQGTKDGTKSDKQSGGMVLLGVGLLLLALGSGGWAARRAFSDRR
jgi:hypothetical protein